MELKRAEDITLTKAQEKFLETFKERILELQNDHYRRNGEEDRYEIKKWEVTQFENSTPIYLSVILGMKNDEGTQAEIFCRYSWHIQVRSKGGCKALGTKYKSKKKTEGFHNCLFSYDYFGKDR